MKTWTKRIMTGVVSIALILVLLSFSCSSSNANSAKTAFADTSPAVSIPSDSLGVLEALQGAFRSISDQVLPTVVELDIVETRKVSSNPLEGFPFFFFGQPDSQNQQEREYDQSGLGSGVIVRKTGNTYYVLTNNHVAGSAKEISIKLNDGRIFTGKLVGGDDRKDIALVSFESKEEIPVAVLGDSDTVKTGDICFAMGTPLGYFSSVTQGIISATGRAGTDVNNISDFIQTDAAINQGNSGGPLVNIYGEVIGINTWIASQSGGSQGLGFSIPINNVKRAIDDFISNGQVVYGWMGVSLVEITDQYKEGLGVKDKKGAFVAMIYLDSPAAKGGMQAGDFIMSLNGKEVKTVDQLVRDVGDLRAGEEARFVVIRGKKEVSLNVKIEKRDNTLVTNSTRLWPGFIASPITDEVRNNLKLDKTITGVAVANIEAKSPAAAMRLQAGDIITAVNDKKVTNIAEFYEALDTVKQKEIWFDVYSEGHSMTTSKYKF
ncbi:MAG TPA: Do family serine endopeptidase [Treponemataceae bacterium]|jgi:Do/DeqQ family serine protease|nr:Do family serine endopeptidase [Treponemataceae bacterium]HQL04936.1 Do family serine endopeptidase [Treponemataceae bacterium]